MNTTMQSPHAPANQDEKSVRKPAGRLDASMLLARKGEAHPAVAATSQNNPGLVWELGNENREPAASPPPSVYEGSDTPSHGKRPVASARLRPESFRPIPTRRSGPTTTPAPMAGTNAVYLSLGIEADTYLRLHYLAQSTGRSIQHVLASALDRHLLHCRVPKAAKLKVEASE